MTIDPKSAEESGRPRRKRLPWSFHEALGYGGRRADEAKARKIVERVGLDAVSDHGDTPLSAAAGLGRVGVVRWLLEQGADVNDAAPHEHFQPPLCAAAYWMPPEAVEVLRLLIAAGADLEASNRFGHTAMANLFINCHSDPLPLAAVLLEAGAAVTERVQRLGDEWNAEAFRALLVRHGRPVS